MNPHSADPGITVEQPIRWGDLDSMGHVNNCVFFQFCESARIAYFDALNPEQFREAPTEFMILATASLNFRKQARYPGTILATANATKISNRSFVLSYTLRDAADGSVVADGDSVCVWLDYATGQSKRLPDAMVQRMAELEHNPALTIREPKPS